MDFLYEFHKREEAPSGLTGTYTGLAEEHARWIGKRLREDEELRIGQEMMRKEVEGWHEHGESMKDGYAKYVQEQAADQQRSSTSCCCNRHQGFLVKDGRS